MPSVKENYQAWNHDYQWEEHGNEWSSEWGGPDVQWFGMLLPRLQRFLPTDSILEIAPGQGRWTEFLKDSCSNLTVVDLSSKCIEYCKTRFNTCEHIQYHVNDGKSLEMVLDQSIDLIVSFDSLVHADTETIEAYLKQFPRILKKNGIAVIHHSNYGNYLPSPAALALAKTKIPKIKGLLRRLGLLENQHWRADDMTAEQFAALSQTAGLRCIGQELINWGSEGLIDCISMVTVQDSRWNRENRIIRNDQFTNERLSLKRLSDLYGARSWPQATNR